MANHSKDIIKLENKALILIRLCTDIKDERTKDIVILRDRGIASITVY